MNMLFPFWVVPFARAGCSLLAWDGRAVLPETSSLAFIPAKTQTQHLLADIPPPSRPVAIAVYGFSDQTGQFKPSETGQTLSRAVSQGGASILVKALQDRKSTRLNSSH